MKKVKSDIGKDNGAFFDKYFKGKNIDFIIKNTIDNKIYYKRVDFAKKYNFTKLTQFSSSFSNFKDKKIGIFDLSNNEDKYYIECKYKTGEYYGIYMSREIVSKLSKDNLEAIFDKIKEYFKKSLITIVGIVSIAGMGYAGINTNLETKTSDLVISEEGGFNYSINDISVLKKNNYDYKNRYGKSLLKSNGGLNETLTVNDFSKAFGYNSDYLIFNSYVFSKLKDESGIKAFGRIKKEVGYDVNFLKNKSIFYIPELKSLKGNFRESYNNLVKKYDLKEGEKYSYIELSKFINDLEDLYQLKGYSSKYGILMNNLSLLPKDLVDTYFIEDQGDDIKNGVTLFLKNISLYNFSGYYLSQGSSQSLELNESTGIINPSLVNEANIYSNNFNNYIKKYNSKYKIDKSDYFYFPLEGNYTGFSDINISYRLENYKERDIEKTLDNALFLKRTAQPEFEYVKNLLGLDANLLIGSVDIGGKNNNKIKKYKEIFNLNDLEFRKSISAGYNININTYIKNITGKNSDIDSKIIDTYSLNKISYFTNDVNLSNVDTNSLFHEFLGHSLFEKEKVKNFGNKKISLVDYFKNQNQIGDSNSIFYGKGWESFGKILYLDYLDGKVNNGNLNGIPEYSLSNDKIGDVGTEFLSVYVPVFLENPTYAIYMEKYGGEESKYFKKIVPYIKDYLSGLNLISGEDWKAYEKEAKLMNKFIIENMNKKIKDI